MAIWDRFKKKTEAPGKASVAKQVSQKAPATKASKASVTKKAKEVKEAKKQKAAVSVSALSTATLLEPVVTEKTANLTSTGVVAFFVPTNANRVTVRQAFREIYKITPVKIRIINVRGKHMRFGLMRGQRQNRKKALITLPPNTRVDIFEKV